MEWVDFRLLKQTVSIAEVLEHYRIVLKPSGPACSERGMSTADALV